MTPTTLAADGPPAAPETSIELYRDITGFAAETPHWVQLAAEVGTEAGLLGFAALFLITWWRARREGTTHGMALALLAPCAMVLAYLGSETLKTVLRQERPCRAVLDAVAIAECPPSGDWSFPSNHATLTAAAAVAIVLAWRRLAPVALPLGLLMGFSRVFVGVHYPHDVLIGMLLGTVTAVVVMLLLAAPAADLVRRLHEVPALRPLLTAALGGRVA